MRTYKARANHHMSDLEGTTQITAHDNNGYEWVVNVCEYLDNQESLEAALEEINADYEVTGNGETLNAQIDTHAA